MCIRDSIYAISVCGVSHTAVFGATFLNRSIGVFTSVGWGVASDRMGASTCYTAVCYLMLVCIVLCATLHEEWQYWVLTVLLAITGTGGFSLGRSLLASLCPKEKASEIFGYAAFAGQVSGFVGPLLFSLTAQITGAPRWGFVVPFVALGLGILLLRTIDFEAKPTNDKVGSKSAQYGAIGAVGDEEHPIVCASEDESAEQADPFDPF
eukprot:TRINITY_DN2147_c0_g1_i2.p1 TRINITY_DN2147_c0_g1~~TRINITY_DN2147_c0_g1_i2.p1  ORF type:complete len:208 (+),score=46.71 TRINITY_DN2147_c0_g1_i2:133-756(+)